MRKSAYVKAIQQAKQLPLEIPELRAYFQDDYNPRVEALRHVMRKAREDRGLFDGEMLDVYISVGDADNRESKA